VTSEEETSLALTLHYDGGAFFGWQFQRDQRTVQGELETAIERLTEVYPTVMGSGRTDRGVHATGQVARVSVPVRWTPAAFRKAINAILPDDIWVKDAQAVPATFHPRYDAVARTYIYRIGLNDEALSPFLHRWCWCMGKPLDRGLLEEAAAMIVGDHSFAAFAKAVQPERGTRCTVTSTVWGPWEELGITFTITANRYLRHMVRYLVGTMVEIARGGRPLDDLSRLIDQSSAKGRGTSPPAPARGLFLAAVEYPAQALGQTRTENR
jgi:tRNA pseudouridine38-40 synthase